MNKPPFENSMANKAQHVNQSNRINENERKDRYTIYGLSNRAYHNEVPFSEYLSSSQLKLYMRSPRYFKYRLENPEEEKSDALAFGSLFHDLMACIVERKSINTGLLDWYNDIALFQEPVNPKNNQPYGPTTKAYKEAYAAFLTANAKKIIVKGSEVELCQNMMYSLCEKSGETSEQVRKLLKWGKPEVSHFLEYEGCKFKFRPDLETKHKIVDWKTVATDDLSERSINSIIAKYGYDISAAFYLFMEHLQSGKWKQFYWIFVSKIPPHDAVMVDASKWTYDYDPITDIAMPQVGAIKMKMLLDLHIKCTHENSWPGSEIFISKSDNGHRIMCPTPPTWEVNNVANLLEQSFNH